MHQEENDDLFVSNCIAINNIDISRKKGTKTICSTHLLRTFDKGTGIQFFEINGWERTFVDALPISNMWKEMAIGSNEPGNVATAGERI